MKLLYPLILCLVCLAAPVAAQGNDGLRVEPAAIDKEIAVDNLDENFEDVTAVVVTNISGRTVSLARRTIDGRHPGVWRYTTLSPGRRGIPYVSDANADDRPVTLATGESATFYVVLRPEGVAGSGTTELRFSDLTVPGTTLGSATLSTRISRTATETEAQGPPTAVRLYPNPAVDRFFVEVPRGVDLGRVEVTNTLGRRIKRFERPSEGSDGYDISKLPDGLYLISIFDDSGKKLKTLRLLHRSFGA